MKKLSFTTKDLVLMGTMNSVIILLYYIIIFLLHMIPPLWGFMDPIASFIMAPAFILMLRLIPKIPVMTIHGAILGILSLFTGWWPGFPAAMLGGLAADLAAKLTGGYRFKITVFVAVPVFTTVKSFLFYLPLYAYTKFPVFEKVVSLWPEEVVVGYDALFAILVLAINLAASLAGLLMGGKMLSRHLGTSGAATA